MTTDAPDTEAETEKRELTTVKDDNAPTLEGRQKAAAFLMALPQSQFEVIMKELDDYEVLEISQTMAQLGKVKAATVENIFIDFMEMTGSSANLTGTMETTEALLRSVYDPERVAEIMEEIRGPAGRNMWDKLNNVDEVSLFGYLKNEHPQTVAVVMSKIRPDHAARVFSLFPQDLAIDVMNRSIRMRNVQREVLANIEETLKSEFIANFARSTKNDPHERLAEVFNYFDRNTEKQMMEALEDANAESAEKIRSLMFTFSDLIKLDPAGIQTVIKIADKSRLALALKGSSDELKEVFFNNMSERASRLIKEDMEALGMVRLKDVDDAQLEIITQTKALVDKGEIVIMQGNDEQEQLIG